MRNLRSLIVLVVVLLPTSGFAQVAPAGAPPAPQVRRSESTGVNLFANNCTSCHGNPPVEHAPSESTIKTMSPERIYEAITTGVMANNARMLDDTSKVLLAEYMGGRKLDKSDAGAKKSMPNPCPSDPQIKDLSGPVWNGWGDLANTRFQPAEAAGLTAGKVSRLELKWSFGFPGATALYGVTVAGGRVFVASDGGYVYSLDAKTGCVHWAFKASAVVRSNITVGPLKPGSNKIMAYFGDIRGNAYALNASNGEQIWKTLTDAHPLARVTGNPRYFDGKLYVPLASLEEDESRSPEHICCTFRGAIVAVNSEDGKIAWKTYTTLEPPKIYKTNSVGVAYMGPSGAGVWTTPIVDTKRRELYFGTGNSFSEPATTSDSIMALNADTGKMLWFKQANAGDVWHGGCQQTIPGRPANGRGGAPGRGGRGGATVAGRPPQPPYPMDNCVDKTGPDWDYSASPNLATMPDGRTVIVASPKQALVRTYDPAKGGEEIWRQDIARGIGGGAGETVFGGAVHGNTIYFGLQLGNGIVAMDLETGVEKWFKPLQQPAEGPMSTHKGIVAAVTLIPGVLFAGGMDGILRAVQPENGTPTP
ncbi:MAG: PQQ-binding-like beta-propeller repeat protein, partial [Terriglobia bacterium]